jgi:murein DD-endopeptidase MepM/ murein hydrolase activator NlpD
MGFARDDHVADRRTQRRPVEAERFGGGRADVVPLRRGRESLAERLERRRAEEERAERARRERIERRRADRDRLLQERLERRRRARLERLRRERTERERQERYVWSRHKPPQTPALAQARKPRREPPRPARARIEPSIRGPVRKRARTAENRRRASTRRRGLFWPTAKAGFAVTIVLGLSATLGSVLGLPVPGLDAGSGRQSLASGAPFGIGAGTAPGLAPGYVFPLIGAPDFGEADARFGASRYGHVHEGQDIFAKPGTPEVAVRDGVVVDRGRDGGRYSGGRGNYVTIYSPADDRSFVYMHMLKPPLVELGDRVHAGQLLGRLGCTGSCWGPHLHFEIRVGKAALRSKTKAIDPLPFLRQWPQATPE